jgi:hypothetical protein
MSCLREETNAPASPGTGYETSCGSINSLWCIAIGGTGAAEHPRESASTLTLPRRYRTPAGRWLTPRGPGTAGCSLDIAS